MSEVVSGVHQIQLAYREGLNAWVAGDMVVDAGGPPHGKRVAQYVRSFKVPVRKHVLTHAHGDHAGGSPAVAAELELPVWIGTRDVEILESGRPPVPDGPLRPFVRRLGNFKGVKVSRGLEDGEDLGNGWVVIDTPGHTPGHISLWREEDRTLIAGDVFFNMNPMTTRTGLRQPFGFATIDAERNRDSMRRVVELEPETVCFGHGPVLREAAPKLRAFVDAL